MPLNVWNGHKPPKPFIVPVFIPHAGCPHRCVFCNQTAITRGSLDLPSSERLRAHIERFLAYGRPHRSPAQISFYGGNFLGLPPSRIEFLLSEAAEFIHTGRAESLRFSTRPDTIDRNSLDLLTPFPVTDVELGAQSMADSILARSRRRHTGEHTRQAVNLLTERRLPIARRMMVALPGDYMDTAMESGRRTAALRPDFVRIYPTVVLRGSPLARWYRSERYHPWSLDKSVSVVADLYDLFSGQGIPVIRMGLQADADLQPGAAFLAGPYHPAFGHLVHGRRFLNAAMDLIQTHALGRSEVSIEVHPQNESKMRGNRNRNIEILKDRFHIKTVKMIRNVGIPDSEIHLLSGSFRYRGRLGDHRERFKPAQPDTAQGGYYVGQQHL